MTDWKIRNARRRNTGGKSDVITTVQYAMTDSEVVGSGDDEVTFDGVIRGSVDLDISSLDSSFVEFNDITEAKLIEWSKAALGERKISEFEGLIADQINESKESTTQTGVPWT